MTVTLGPAPCRGCGKHVWWNGRHWTDKDGLSHSCIHATKIGRRYWNVGKIGRHPSWSKS
jgi:hypothetical protein